MYCIKITTFSSCNFVSEEAKTSYILTHSSLLVLLCTVILIWLIAFSVLALLLLLLLLLFLVLRYIEQQE